MRRFLVLPLSATILCGVLAIAVAPMALIAAGLGLRNRLSAHRWLGKLTMPLWLYVSVTGVVVYWMLYRLYAPV